MYSNLFTIKDGLVVPLTAREATIKEVRMILARDKGSPGDSDGRNKLFAYKELGAVYWIADYRSPGRMNGYTGTALIEDAIRNFELPSNWRPDKVVNDLIRMYEDHVNGGIAVKVLLELTATFNLTLQTISKARENLHLKLNAQVLTTQDLKEIMELENNLIEMTTTITKKIKDVKSAIEDLKQAEAGDIEIARGGIQVTNSMRPS